MTTMSLQTCESFLINKDKPVKCITEPLVENCGQDKKKQTNTGKKNVIQKLEKRGWSEVCKKYSKHKLYH